MAEAQLSAFLDAAVDAIIVIDLRGTIETFNQSAERLFGYSAGEVLSQNVKLLMPEPYRSAHDQFLRNYIQTGDPKIIGVGREVEARHKDGSTFPIELAVGQVKGDVPRFVGIIRDLRERKAAEQALLESEARYRTLVQSAGNAIIALSPDILIDEWNEEAERLYGYSREQVLGGDYVERFVPEDARGTVRNDVQRVLDGQKSRSFENSVIDRDGNVHYMLWNVSRRLNAAGVPIGVMAIGQDISRRRATEKLLARREEELRLIIENAPTAIFTLDIEGRILSVNRACTEALGYAQSELGELTLIDITHPEDVAKSVEFTGNALRGELEAYSLEKRYIHKDGRVVDAFLHAGVVHGPAGKPVTLVAQFEVRTAQLKAEHEAQEHRERLAHIDRLNILGEMAASIAHEINQPLTVITARTNAARRRIQSNQLDPDKLIESLDKVNAQAHRAGEVIRKLRGLVKKHESQRTSADLNELVSDSVEFAQVDARLHDASIRLELAPALEPVIVDVVQIQQVILNLLRNAIDATEAAGLRDAEIIIETRRQAPNLVQVAVVDRGGGINPDVGDHLFDPFFTTKREGMGMGLSISRSLVNAHGGRLWFEPHEAGGTVFRLTLPTAKGEDNG